MAAEHPKGLLGRLRPGAGQPFGFDDLILIKSWRGSLLLIVAGLVICFLLFGFWWPYWRIADMDLWMVYEGWVFNDRAPQEWFDHPGYLTILFLGEWFRFLHAIGLLDVHALSAVPAPQDAEPAWTAATRAGRVLSLLLSCGFVLAFGALIRRLVGDSRVAVLATFALAFSGGVAMNTRIMRTELISAGALTIALLILLIAARSPQLVYRPLLVGLAAFLATLGHINKVQVIFLICVLPLLVLPFGATSAAPRRNSWGLYGVIGLFTIAVAIPAALLIAAGLSVPAPIPWVVLGLNLSGIYQIGIAAWIVAAVIAFAVVWRVPAAETCATMLCVLAGISLALLSLYIRYSPQNVVIAINPLEQLLFWAKASSADGQGNLLTDILRGVGVVLTTRTFVLDPSARPTIFLEWMVLAGIVIAWRSGNRTLALQAATLIGAGWAMDALYAIRGLKLQYFILTDPLIVIAAALLLAQLQVMRDHRWTFAIGAVLLATHVAISQAEPVKHTFSRSKPLAMCVPHFGYTKRIEMFSFCPPVPQPSAR